MTVVSKRHLFLLCNGWLAGADWWWHMLTCGEIALAVFRLSSKINISFGSKLNQSSQDILGLLTAKKKLCWQLNNAMNPCIENGMSNEYLVTLRVTHNCSCGPVQDAAPHRGQQEYSSLRALRFIIGLRLRFPEQAHHCDSITSSSAKRGSLKTPLGTNQTWIQALLNENSAGY